MSALRSVATAGLPEPPYPEDTKSGGWEPLFSVRTIKQSRTWNLAESGRVRNGLLRLWMEAWEQLPCGSFPNDDELIAIVIEMQLGEFQACRSQIMRGWVLHSDDRFYHPYITEEVIKVAIRRKGGSKRQREFRKREKEKRERSNVLHDGSNALHDGSNALHDGSNATVTRSNTTDVDVDVDVDKSKEKTLVEKEEISRPLAPKTSPKKTASSKKTLPPLENVERIINHLNEKTGRGFGFKHLDGKLTKGAELVRSRLAQYPEAKLIEMLESKITEWAGGDMEKYLTPDTLFRASNCEKYVGAISGTGIKPTLAPAQTSNRVVGPKIERTPEEYAKIKEIALRGKAERAAERALRLQASALPAERSSLQ